MKTMLILSILFLLLLGCEKQSGSLVDDQSDILVDDQSDILIDDQPDVHKLAYIEQAESFLKEIPFIIEENDILSIGLFGKKSELITKEQLDLFWFMGWMPIDEPDESIREDRINVVRNSKNACVISIGDKEISLSFIMNNDCTSVWVEDVSLNLSYPQFMEYQIPHLIAREIRWLRNEVLCLQSIDLFVQDINSYLNNESSQYLLDYPLDSSNTSYIERDNLSRDQIQDLINTFITDSWEFFVEYPLNATEMRTPGYPESEWYRYGLYFANEYPVGSLRMWFDSEATSAWFFSEDQNKKTGYYIPDSQSVDIKEMLDSFLNQ